MLKSIYRFFIFAALILIPGLSFAQSSTNRINHFIVEENLLKNDKLAIIATDSLDQPLESINGTFQFSLNNFNYPLEFHDGVAITPNKVEKSTFVFIKHVNESGSHGQLFYVLKSDSGLNPVKISWVVLLIVPAILVLIGMMFRKLLSLAVIAILIFLYFNYKHGMDLTTFFETMVHGIKGVF
ncbi:hypothetical protein [Albibacterium sp.]|uniref:hypothetical protein n=1 Tax=Albibacterium sp. TaxID=2952885 RepID=UPI002C9ECE64|nr:hypothetical protein [Albibacterium sp.]HUH18511.1 hypothetical protein [Albibacterium sp.]